MKTRVVRKITEKDISSDEIFSLLLKDRGISDVDTFLHPTHPRNIFFDEFFSDAKKFEKDWTRTIDLLKKIKTEKKMIVVYMDYDADGITGGAIMWQTLHSLGFTVMPHVPDRKTEGYGFSKIGLDAVKEKYDPSLIISVDHGIVAHEQIAYAVSLGIDIIVTDHHQKKETNPEKAFAIFHTDKVSGSGVAYFFAKELLESFKDEVLQQRFSGDFLALASIGIIADLVPLTEFARCLAHHGLAVLSKSEKFSKENLGLMYLLKESGVLGKKITAYDVGFIIAPRINAFGRIRSAIDALRLLCTQGLDRAKQLAVEANIINKERQDLVTEAIDEAQKLVDHSQKILLIHSDTWEEGIIGLIAGKLTQEFNKPSIVMTKSDGHFKASVRSIPGIDITVFLRDLEEYFIDLGGHAAAAGLSIKANKIESFRKALYEKAQKEITDEMLKPEVLVDMELPIELLTYDLGEKLEQFEPFGIGNKTPVFMTSGQVQDILFMGSLKQHAKILLKSNGWQVGAEFIEAVYFNGAEEVKNAKGKKVSLLGNVYIDTWNGRKSFKLRVRNLLKN